MAAKGYDRGIATEHRFVRPNVVACDSWRGKDETYTQDLEHRSCTCPDFIYRRAAKGEICKHLAAILVGREDREPLPVSQAMDAPLTDIELREMFS